MPACTRRLSESTSDTTGTPPAPLPNKSAAGSGLLGASQLSLRTECARPALRSSTPQNKHWNREALYSPSPNTPTLSPQAHFHYSLFTIFNFPRAPLSPTTFPPRPQAPLPQSHRLSNFPTTHPTPTIKASTTHHPSIKPLSCSLATPPPAQPGRSRLVIPFTPATLT